MKEEEGIQDKVNKALNLILEIEENIGVCCAITMEPDEVLLLIDELKEVLEGIE